MKNIILLSFSFSIIFPIVFYGFFTVDMRQIKMYESYVDSTGDVQQREKEQDMYSKSGGVYSQYWQFWGLKRGVINWLKYTVFCFLMVIPFMIVLSFSITRGNYQT